MPRTSLSTDDKSYKLRTFRTVDNATGEILDSSSDIVEVERRVRSRVTVNTPGYRTMKKSDLPMNPFSYEEYYEVKPQGVQVTKNAISTSTLVGRLNFVDSRSPEGVSSGDREAVDQEAQYAGLSRLKDTKINLGVAFGERRQTAQLLLKGAGAVGNVFRDLKRADFKGAARHLGITERQAENALARQPKRRRDVSTPDKALSNGWLALQFGVRPLLADIHGALEVLADEQERTIRVRARKSRRWKSSHSEHLWDNVPAVREESGIYGRQYLYDFVYSDASLHDLAAVGITNPLSVAYELLTLSFVFDYFVNVGGYLDLWDATLGLSLVRGCTTSFEKVVVKYGCAGSAVVAGTTHTVNGTGSYEMVKVARQTLTSFPTPDPPLFNPRINWQRGVSMAALIHQRLRH